MTTWMVGAGIIAAIALVTAIVMKKSN